MALSEAYTLATGRLPEVFAKIRDGQAPDQFSVQLLKDWGFTSSNDRAAIPILKAIGFLSPDGKPTSVYHDYRDHSRSKAIMAQAIRSAYSDIFLIKAHPTEADKGAVQGKFKSFHNVSDNVANLMTKTFFALLGLADLNANSSNSAPASPVVKVDEAPPDQNKKHTEAAPHVGAPSLHYNIQIHLPATKDVEVYNAIFKSLRAHLLAS